MIRVPDNIVLDIICYHHNDNTHLVKIPDNDLVIGLPRSVDQLQSDAG